MAEKKPKRKELLNEPDEFITWSTRIIEFVQRNQRATAIGAAVFVLVILASFVYYGYQSRRQATSHEMLETAIRSYEKLAASENPKNSSANDKLFDIFRKISRDYSDLPSGQIAILYEGHILFNKGDFKGALDKYNQFQSSILARKGLGPLALYNMAQSEMALKDYETAINLFDQLTRDINSPYRREAYSSIARIYEMMEKKKEAAQAYKQYLKVFPEAPDADFVKTKIAQLSEQG